MKATSSQRTIEYLLFHSKKDTIQTHKNNQNVYRKKNKNGVNRKKLSFLSLSSLSLAVNWNWMKDKKSEDWLFFFILLFFPLQLERERVLSGVGSISRWGSYFVLLFFFFLSTLFLLCISEFETSSFSRFGNETLKSRNTPFFLSQVWWESFSVTLATPALTTRTWDRIFAWNWKSFKVRKYDS